MDLPPLTPPDLTDLTAQVARRDWWGRREIPFRYLLDSRLFRLLCNPKTGALDSFRASLARHGLAPEGGLPDLEMTPLAVLDALGVEAPQFPKLPLTEDLIALEDIDLSILLSGAIKRDFAKAPALQAADLRKRAEKLRQSTDPAAHPLFDLCLTRFVSREDVEDVVLTQLAFDALFRFRFPEEIQEDMSDLFNCCLIDKRINVAGLSKVRLLKVFWARSYDRIIKKHPQERGEIQVVTREIASRGSRDFLDWEVIHHATLGYPGNRVQPVIAFAPDPEAILKARCRAYKTALRAFLDQFSPEDLATVRSRINLWKPGWLVPCRTAGTFDSAVSTSELPIF